jgi:hypothetical protein
MRERSDDLTPAEQKLLDDVDEFGLHIVHVAETEAAPGYSFSVGLWESFEQPEVVVVGLPDEVAEDLLNSLADEAAEGTRFLAGQDHQGLVVGYPVRFVGVPEAMVPTWLPTAQWAYAGATFPCVQLVWPDKQGRWPWDPAVREGFAAAQPVLGREAP